VRVDLEDNLFAVAGLDKLLGTGVKASMGRVANGIAQTLAQKGKYLIRTSPTTGDWSRFYRDTPRWQGSVRATTGRVDTGAMHDAFKARIDSSGAGPEISIEIGWLDNPPDYTDEQEYGFRWEGGPPGFFIDVPGMFVLSRTQEDLDELVNRAIDRHVGKMLRSMGAKG
jgi:hypothetical protein